MNALEFYRLRNDLTQEELGKRIGVSKQTIYKWEKQIAPVSSKHYQTLKDILNLSESEMVNVISGGEISRDASVAENIDPDSLARQYRVLQQRLKQVDSEEDRKIIEDKLANLDRISRHVADAISDPGDPLPPFPSTPDTIRNTPELRECIKDAMLREGVRNASELNRRIGYDSVNSLERLLAGKLNWFPDVLSAVLDGLNIKHDDAALSELLEEAESHGDFCRVAVIEASIPDEEPARINISLPRYVLDKIDRYAEQHNRTRSAFLAESAMSYIRSH